eukprot:3523511-Pleurochrysis_carterae.AAC.4
MEGERKRVGRKEEREERPRVERLHEQDPCLSAGFCDSATPRQAGDAVARIYHGTLHAPCGSRVPPASHAWRRTL